METLTDKTEAVIYGMLTENTGTHFLDSGGTNGRLWQRNQQLTLDDFKKQPDATIDPEWGDVEKSLYHHLNSYLTFDEPLNAHFEAFAKGLPDEGWLEVIELWLDSLGVDPEGGDFYGDARWVFNSYNFEYWLTQTIQGATFGLNGQGYLILQVHGGADVRGGYTAPKVFRLEYKDEFILNAESAYFSCSNPECDQRLDVGPDGYWLCDEYGNQVERYPNERDIAKCTCGATWN